jgi:hypothetical protein
MFKVVYQAGGWPELVDVEARCELTPCAEALPPPPQTPPEQMLEAHGRHYVEDGVKKPRGPRDLVAHTHTYSSGMKNPGVSMLPRDVEGFHTQFNMAQATLSRKQAEADEHGEPTTVVLGLLAAVRPEEELAGGNTLAGRAHFLTQKVNPFSSTQHAALLVLVLSGCGHVPSESLRHTRGCEGLPSPPGCASQRKIR